MITELVEVLKRGLRVDVGILNPLFACDKSVMEKTEKQFRLFKHPLRI